MRRSWMRVLPVVVGFAASLAIDATAAVSDPIVAVDRFSGRDTTNVLADSIANTDRLPFAGKGLPERDRSYGIGLGIGTYQCRMTGVEEAFQAIEDTYRSAGHTIPRPSKISLQPMQIMTLSFRLNRTFLLAGEAGFSGNEFKDSMSNRVKLIGGTIYVHFAPMERMVGEALTLFAGLGGGKCRFSLVKSYSAVVASDGYGSYDVLEHIIIEGSGAYRTLVGGVTVHPGRRAAIDFLAQRVDVGRVSGIGPAGSMSVDMGGTVFCVRLTLFR